MAMYNGRRVIGVAIGGTIVYVDGQPVAIFDADTKLEKQTGESTVPKVYVKNEDGTQGGIDVTSSYSFGASIVRRTSTGYLLTPLTPLLNDHATSKKYVDDNFSVIYKHDVTILLNRAGSVNEFYKIRGHVFNNSATALTTLSECFLDLICEYGGDENASCYAVQKIPRVFIHDDFSSPRAAFIFTSSAGVITYIDPSDTSVISDVSVSDVAAKL